LRLNGISPIATEGASPVNLRSPSLTEGISSARFSSKARLAHFDREHDLHVSIKRMIRAVASSA
jgi:hypothetical protein